MLWPCIREYYNFKTDSPTTNQDPNRTEIARIVVLTAFIDLFNYYPLRVCKIRYKNDSNELTYIMNSNTRGTKNERGEVMMPKPEPKTEKERHLYSLLQLVSDKIRERFVNLKACFRYLDTNHTQSISLNEWAQGIDVMRLRISFEDIKTLFNYLDREGSGMLKYENFTYLLEERWRGIDPIEATLNQMKDTLKNPMEPHD